MDAETRKKISDAMKGYKHSEETKKKISESMKTYSNNEEVKERKRQAMKLYHQLAKEAYKKHLENSSQDTEE